MHFLIIGAALFAVYPWLTPGAPERAPATAPAREVVINAATVESLVDSWQQAWQRPPTGEELDQLIEEDVRAEILSREARALGLDRDDEVIRGILRDRMEFMAENSASIGEPAEAQLKADHAANPERFGGGLVISFSQVLLKFEGPAADREAQALLARLQAGVRAG